MQAVVSGGISGAANQSCHSRHQGLGSRKTVTAEVLDANAGICPRVGNRCLDPFGMDGISEVSGVVVAFQN